VRKERDWGRKMFSSTGKKHGFHFIDDLLTAFFRGFWVLH
jgi:hypothetical protein